MIVLLRALMVLFALVAAIACTLILVLPVNSVG